LTKLESWLMQACAMSGLKVDIAFSALIGNQKIQSVARIQGLGAPNGMLIFRSYDEVRSFRDDVMHARYGYSVLSEPAKGEEFDLRSFQEMFRDWGWSESVDTT